MPNSVRTEEYIHDMKYKWNITTDVLVDINSTNKLLILIQVINSNTSLNYSRTRWGRRSNPYQFD